MKTEVKTTLLAKMMTVVVAVLILVAVAIYVNTRQVNKLKAIVAQGGVAVDLRGEVKDLLIWELDYALTGSSDSKDRTDALFDEIDGTMTGLLDQYSGDGVLTRPVEAMKKTMEGVKTTAQALRDASDKKDAAAVQSSLDEYHNMGDELNAGSALLVTTFDVRTDKALKISLWMAIGLGIVIVPVIMIPLFLLSLAITREVRSLMEFGSRMGDGDLTRTLAVARRDEIGQLGQCFNDLNSKLHGIVQKMSQTTELLQTSSKSMGQSATAIRDGAGKQSEQAAHAAVALGEMSKTAVRMATDAQDAASASQKAAEEARSSGDIVGLTVEGMQTISKTVQSSAEVVKVLGESSGQIETIVKVIEDIADQTHLLALNATIEAARAGEQGRGFSVVADEVRKLAERTTKATKEIGDVLGKIQSETKGVVVSMDQGVKEVGRGVELANQAKESLRKVVDNIGHATQMVSQIAAAIEEHTATTEEITASVDLVSNLSQKFAEDANKTYEASSGLQKMADQLSLIVDNFQLRKQAESLNLDAAPIEVEDASAPAADASAQHA